MLARVEPVDTVAEAHGPLELQLLLAQSHEHGSLPDEEHGMLAGALRLEQARLADLARPWEEVVTVPVSASVASACALSRTAGHSRLVVLEQAVPVGLVHVRELITADPAATLRDLIGPIESMSCDLSLIDALQTMRARRAHLALVTEAGQPAGAVSLEDLLEEILGRFDDETDRLAV